MMRSQLSRCFTVRSTRSTDRDRAHTYIRERHAAGETATGLLYISSDSKDVHDQNDTVPVPLYNLPHEQLCPGSAALQKLQEDFR